MFIGVIRWLMKLNDHFHLFGGGCDDRIGTRDGRNGGAWG
jgi:hypothetical protein